MIFRYKEQLQITEYVNFIESDIISLITGRCTLAGSKNKPPRPWKNIDPIFDTLKYKDINCLKVKNIMQFDTVLRFYARCCYNYNRDTIFTKYVKLTKVHNVIKNSYTSTIENSLQDIIKLVTYVYGFRHQDFDKLDYSKINNCLLSHNPTQYELYRCFENN
jgi:hypothetical protein